MIKNYRKIKLPDCCAVCKHYDNDECSGHICLFNLNVIIRTVINGLCDDFEGEEE